MLTLPQEAFPRPGDPGRLLNYCRQVFLLVAQAQWPSPSQEAERKKHLDPRTFALAVYSRAQPYLFFSRPFKHVLGAKQASKAL